MKYKLIPLILLSTTINAESLFRIDTSKYTNSIEVKKTQGINGSCGSSNNAIFSSIPTEYLCLTPYGNTTIININSQYIWSCLGSPSTSSALEGNSVNCSASEPTTKCVYDDNNKYYVHYDYYGYSWIGRNSYKYRPNANDSFTYIPNQSPLLEQRNGTGIYSNIGPIYITTNFSRGQLRKNIAGNPAIVEYEICFKNPLPERTPELVTTCYISGNRAIRHAGVGNIHGWSFDNITFFTPYDHYNINQAYDFKENNITITDINKIASIKSKFSAGALYASNPNVFRICETKLQ